MMTITEFYRVEIAFFVDRFYLGKSGELLTRIKLSDG